MKTEIIESGKAAVANNPVTNEKKNTQFVAGNPVNKESAKPAEPAKAAESAKVEQTKTDAPKVDAPKVEALKADAPKIEPAKPVLNLEGTLKLVEELHRRKIQRDKLLETIDNLEGFEVEQREELDETGGNIYQGCTLTIEDDNRRKFVTKNPTIIWTVSQMVNSLCVNKLAEIEAGITIPQA